MQEYNLDSIVEEEIKSYDLVSNKIQEVSHIFLELSTLPAAILLSIQNAFLNIKNNETQEALNYLENILVDINSINQKIIQSIQILKQEN